MKMILRNQELDGKKMYEALKQFVSNKVSPVEREINELVEMEESISR